MSDDDIRKLDKPSASDYDEKLWTALAYAREWVRVGGLAPAPGCTAALKRHYSPAEIDDIEAVITIMDFANRTNNTFMTPLDREKAFQK